MNTEYEYVSVSRYGQNSQVSMNEFQLNLKCSF